MTKHCSNQGIIASSFDSNSNSNGVYRNLIHENLQTPNLIWNHFLNISLLLEMGKVLLTNKPFCERWCRSQKSQMLNKRTWSFRKIKKTILKSLSDWPLINNFYILCQTIVFTKRTIFSNEFLKKRSFLLNELFY